jgi:hypothetical protein
MFKWNALAPYAVAGLVSLLRPGIVAAQPDGLDLEVDKAMAKARFAVDQAKPAELARQMVQAARDVYEFQLAKYRFGTIQPEALFESELLLRRAQLAVKEDTTPGTGRINSGPVLEAAWRQAWHADELARSKYRAARVTIADVSQTSIYRLALEIELARLRENKPEK